MPSTTVIDRVTNPLADAYAPIREHLAAAECVFDAELAGDLPFVGEMCDIVRSYRGKMLRPALLLLTAEAVGGVRHEHHTLAAVVEMVHMATLVHDDVLDEAAERRRQPTIRSISGNAAAVLLGDYLISHAFHLCSGLRSQSASRRVGATTNTVCEGELLQNHHRGNLALREEEYYDIVRRKTGALTAVACELGASHAGADEAVVTAMHDFGMAAGVAFQIVDDLLDIAGEQREVGKSLGRDVALGKATLPVIHCLGSASAVAKSEVASILRGERPYDARRLAALLRDSGSLDYAMIAARAEVETALGKLTALPHSAARTSLASLAELITQRHM